MPKCKQCGKWGLFLKLNKKTEFCAECNNEHLKMPEATKGNQNSFSTKSSVKSPIIFTNPLGEKIIKSDMDMKLFEFEIMKKLQKKPVSEIYETFYYFDKNTISRKVDYFMKSGYFKVAKDYELLDLLTLPDLKNILKANNLKVSGKKQELIERIQQNIQPEDLADYLPKGEYPLLTESGKRYYNELLLYKESKFNTLFDLMIIKILSDKDFNSAYKYMCAYESKQVYERGIGMNFDDSRNYSLPPQTEQMYIKFIDEDESENKVISALAIVFNMLGMGADKMQNKIDRFCNAAAIEPINKDTVFNSMMKLHSKVAINSSKSYNAQYEYQILSTKDSRTCELCKSMNGKVFKAADAKVGINAPPFHDGCRCVTVMYFPKDEIDEAFEKYQKEKGVTIPADMDFDDYYEKIKNT